MNVVVQPLGVIAESVIVPLYRPIATMLTVVLPVDPAGTVISDGDASSAISGVITCTVNVTE